MPRYFGPIRPRYGEEDFAANQAATHGIGAALGSYLSGQRERSQEEMEVGAAGGTIEPGPSAGDRFRSFGSGIAGAARSVAGGFNRTFRPGAVRAGEQTTVDRATAQPLPGVQYAAPSGHQNDFLRGGAEPPPEVSSRRGGIADELASLGYGGSYSATLPSGRRATMRRPIPAGIVEAEVQSQERLTSERETRASAERVAGMGAISRVQAARISADARRGPAPESPNLAASRRSATARNVAETGKIGEEREAAGRKQMGVQADQLVQALHAQNPGHIVTPEEVRQYHDGLVRNKRLKQAIPDEELYAALDRYHNPPNRAPTTAQVMSDMVTRETSGRAGSAGGAGSPKADARTRYSQLQQRGMSQQQILAQMAREGYPPPPKKK